MKNSFDENLDLRFQEDDKKGSRLEKFGRGFHTSKFKSLFDKEGNPFKYFKDIKKHLNTSSQSFQV